MAIGDDRTDEDLFRALPPSTATIVVGHRPSAARFRAADYREVRRILRSFIDGAKQVNTSAGTPTLPLKGSASSPVVEIGGQRHHGD
jgi:hypothetical protein